MTDTNTSSSPSPDTPLDAIYGLVANEEDARVCRDIPDEACSDLPRNFFLQVAARILTKLGDALANPKTVLAWLLTLQGAPAYLVAFLVPIRESGSMIPQIFIAGYIRTLARRKWVWVIGSVLQAGAVAAMGVTAISMSGVAAGWMIIALLTLFSLARGLSSIASKDVLGKTVPKRRRGRLTGLAASLSGVLTLGVALWLLMAGGTRSYSAAFYGMLLTGASGLWLAAAGIFAAIQEHGGATEGGRNAIRQAIRSLSLLRTESTFRHFVFTRALMLCSALSAPYYVVLAQEHYGTGNHLLGLFILANGLASSLSATVWGRAADRSSRQVMIGAGTATALTGIALFTVVNTLPAVSGTSWLYPLAFFFLGIAHSGVRMGRKTYVVDLASGNRRTDYVAVSNTVIGVILLVSGSVGALTTVLSADEIILVLSLFGVAGALAAWRLPEVE